MIGPGDQSEGTGDPFWSREEDERLLAALPPELLSWVELQLGARGTAPDRRPHAEAVRRYLVAVARIAATTCPAIGEEAVAEALSLPFTPDPTAAAITVNDWAKIIQAGAACHGDN